MIWLTVAFWGSIFIASLVGILIHESNEDEAWRERKEAEKCK